MSGMFDRLGKKQDQVQAPHTNPRNILADFKNDPKSFFQERNLDVPDNLLDNPGAIIQHLIQSGQLPQSRLGMAQQQLMQMLGRK